MKKHEAKYMILRDVQISNELRKHLSTLIIYESLGPCKENNRYT